MLLTTHHIACDAWWMGILLRELRALYQAIVMRAPPALAALPIQYADYAVWQRHLLEGEMFRNTAGLLATTARRRSPAARPLMRSPCAVRLFAHIDKIFGQKLPLATLFQAPTVEQLANVLARGDGYPLGPHSWRFNRKVLSLHSFVSMHMVAKS